MTAEAPIVALFTRVPEGLRTVVLQELWDVDDAVDLRRWHALEAAIPDPRPSRSSE